MDNNNTKNNNSNLFVVKTNTFSSTETKNNNNNTIETNINSKPKNSNHNSTTSLLTAIEEIPTKTEKNEISPQEEKIEKNKGLKQYLYSINSSLIDKSYTSKSLFIFSKDNKFRIFLQLILAYGWYNFIIYLLIFINSLLLILETIKETENLSEITNYIFTLIFTIEFLMKIISYGFVLDDNSYLRDPWNWLDFIVVITGLLSFFNSISVNLFCLRIFRLIRPMKSINYFPNIKLFILSLINSLSDMGTLLLISFYFFIILGCLGLTLLSERMHYRCRTTNEIVNGTFPLNLKYVNNLCGGELKCYNENNTINLCINSMDYYPDLITNFSLIQEENDYEGVNYGITDYNDIIISIFTNFFTVTSEGWSNIMNMYMDGYNIYVSFLYFIICTFINYYIIWNLTTAVLLYNFEKNLQFSSIENKIKNNKNNKNNFLQVNITNKTDIVYKKKYRLKYFPLQSFRIKSKGFREFFQSIKLPKCFARFPRISKYHKKYKIGYYSYVIIEQPIIQFFIYMSIIYNALILTFDRVDIPEKENNIWEISNIVLVIIFVVENLFILVGQGLLFFKNFWNDWDLIINIVSIIEIIINYSNNNRNSNNYTSIFRTLRILRIFKLFRKWENFQVIVQTIQYTIIRLTDYILLFCLFIYMFTLLGYSFFSGALVNEIYNFDNFISSFITTFLIVIGDHWYNIFFACIRNVHATKTETYVYFTSILFFGNMIIMNIFLAYLVYNFQTAKKMFEKNLIVKNYINNINYYVNRIHEIHLRKLKRIKSNDDEDKNGIKKLDKVLQKLMQKNLVYEEEFLFKNKNKIDWNKYKVIDESDDEQMNNQKVVNFEKKFKGDKKYNGNNLDDNISIDIDQIYSFYKFNEKYNKPYKGDKLINHNSSNILKTEKFLGSNNNLRTFKNLSTLIIEENNTTINKLSKLSNLNFVDSSDNKYHLNPVEQDNFIVFNFDEEEIENRLIKKTSNTDSEKNINNNNLDKKISLGNSLIIDNILSTENENYNSSNLEDINKKKIYFFSIVWDYMKNSSLFIFHKDSKFRKIVKKIAYHKIFNYTILLLIIANCILMCIDNNFINTKSKKKKFLNISNKFFNVVFLIECLLKIISDNFILNDQDESLNFSELKTFLKENENKDFLNDNSLDLSNIESLNDLNQSKINLINEKITSLKNKPYLKDSTNIIDFICVIFGTLDLFVSRDFSYFKTLRAFRAIKPIRLLAKSDNLNLMIKSLIKSLPSLGNVILVCFLAIFIFALLGVSLFKNQLRYYCSNLIYKNKEDCINNGYSWYENPYNFNNFLWSLLTNFEIMMAENWGNIMAIAGNKYKDRWIYWYFFLYVIIGYMFVLNLIVGVVIEKFRILKDQEKEKIKFITEQEKEWINLQNLMIKFKPKYMYPNEDEISPFRKKCLKLITSKYFNNSIIILIILSLLTLLIQIGYSNKYYNYFLDALNYVFTFLFNIEIVLKIYVSRKIFFFENWNIYDFVIIIFCDICCVLNFLQYGGIIHTKYLNRIPIIFRTFRIFKIIRKITFLSKIKPLIDTFGYFIPNLGSVAIIMFLLILIYANVGMSFFGNVPYRKAINKNMNFRNFFKSIILLYQVTAKEHWTDFMYELAYHDCRDNSSEKYKNDSFCMEYNIICYDDNLVNYTSMTKYNMYSCGNNFSYPFFISFIVIGPLFIMSLCITMVIEGFNEAMNDNEGYLNVDYMQTFLKIWMKYDYNGIGLVKPYEFVLILKELLPPIGINYDRFIDRRNYNNEKIYYKLLAHRHLINIIRENKMNIQDFQHLSKETKNAYEFDEYYMTKDGNFFTTDTEVMCILNKLNVMPCELKEKEKLSFLEKIKGKIFIQDSKSHEEEIESSEESESSNFSNNNKSRKKNVLKNRIKFIDYYVYFVDACIVLSKYIISRMSNIEFNRLRNEIVDLYTKKYWVNEFSGDKKFISNHIFLDEKKLKKSDINVKLSFHLAIKMLYKKVLKKHLINVRKKIIEKEENKKQKEYLDEIGSVDIKNKENSIGVYNDKMSNIFNISNNELKKEKFKIFNYSNTLRKPNQNIKNLVNMNKKKIIEQKSINVFKIKNKLHNKFINNDI